MEGIEADSTGDCYSQTPKSKTTVGRIGKRKWRKTYSLPPCRVCGAAGTGVHYGVNTCEACKGFFRRGLDRQKSFKCRHNDRCLLRQSNKAMCPHCRYNRCKDVGMSLEGIKIGRYTLQKRSADTIAVKQIEADQVFARKVSDEHNQKEEFIRQLMVAAQTTIREMDTMMAAMKTAVTDQFQEDQHHLSTLKDVPLFDFADFLCDADMSRVTDVIRAIENEQETEVQLYAQFLRDTESLVKCANRLAKSVPGYMELPVDDKIALLKVSFHERRVIEVHQRVTEQGVLLLDKDSGIKVEVFCGEELSQQLVALMRRLKKCCLTPEETLLLAHLVVFSSDRCNLEEPQKVSDIQERILDALQWLLKKNHPTEKLLFPRLISILTEMRSFAELLAQHMLRVVTRNSNSGLLQVPPLFWELMGGSFAST